jgi:phage baseplate assembly protein W
MTDIAFIDNDIHIACGDFHQIKDVDVLKQNILRRFTTPRGSIFFDENFGSECHRWINARDIRPKYIASHLKQVAIECDEVNPESVTVSVTQSGEKIICTIELELLEIGIVEKLFLSISNNGVEANFI